MAGITKDPTHKTMQLSIALMRYDGVNYANKSGESHKVWGSTLLINKADYTKGIYVPAQIVTAWGPANGSVQFKRSPITTFGVAQELYGKIVGDKLAAGYKHADVPGIEKVFSMMLTHGLVDTNTGVELLTEVSNGCQYCSHKPSAHGSEGCVFAVCACTWTGVDFDGAAFASAANAAQPTVATAIKLVMPPAVQGSVQFNNDAGANYDVEVSAPVPRWLSTLRAGNCPSSRCCRTRGEQWNAADKKVTSDVLCKHCSQRHGTHGATHPHSGITGSCPSMLWPEPVAPVVAAAQQPKKEEEPVQPRPARAQRRIVHLLPTDL